MRDLIRSLSARSEYAIVLLSAFGHALFDATGLLQFVR